MCACTTLHCVQRISICLACCFRGLVSHEAAFGGDYDSVEDDRGKMRNAQMCGGDNMSTQTVGVYFFNVLETVGCAVHMLSCDIAETTLC